MQYLHAVKCWLKGEYPLNFTYWITGFLPYAMVRLCLYTINYQVEHALMEPGIAYRLILLIMALCFIFVPMILCAILFSTIYYNGLLLWKIISFLVVIRCVIYYFMTYLELLMMFLKG